MDRPAVRTNHGRVLVVEDDATIREVVRRYLERAGFEVDEVGDGHLALDRAATRRPDLVVLDLMLPGLDGMEVCRRLRAGGATATVPIVVLTARGDEEDRIRGFALGADDYVPKPFSPRELVARIEAVLRRARGNAASDTGSSDIIEAGPIRIDRRARTAIAYDQPLTLTTKELDLLTALAAEPGRAFRREELLEQVWGWAGGDTSTVTVHIRRLRTKIEIDPSAPVHLLTVFGHGYRFEAAASEPSQPAPEETLT